MKNLSQYDGKERERERHKERERCRDRKIEREKERERARENVAIQALNTISRNALKKHDLKITIDSQYREIEIDRQIN